MSSSISTKNKNIGMQYMKKSIEYISGAAGRYISDVMPISTSTVKDASSAAKEIQSKFSSNIRSIMPKIKQLKNQQNFKSISDWFLDKENELDNDFSELDSLLDFDDSDLDSSDIEDVKISESEKSANKVSKTVVETSHRLVESQISATANMVESLDRQMSIISAGFDRTNETLNKLLEVVTQNTSTLIESSVVANTINEDRKISARDKMVSGGNFEFSKYKEIISNNINSSQLGIIAAFLPLVKTMFKTEGIKPGPSDIIDSIVSGAINKLTPKLGENLSALDSAINDTIMTSLIRLGENNSFGLGGTLSRVFGIKSDRVNVNTSRASLEVKAVPFDSIVRESIVTTIPGYLQKILVKLGGKDLVYDYRSRSFKSQDKIKNEFMDYAANNGSIYNLSNSLYNKISVDNNSSNLYDLLMTDLGTKTRGGEFRRIIESFKDKDIAESYFENLLSKYDVSDEIKNSSKLFANKLTDLVNTDDLGTIELGNSIAKSNINRKLRLEEYVNEANSYDVDLSNIKDSVGNDIQVITSRMGLKEKQTDDSRLQESSVTRNKKHESITGLNYTNIALYEIYRRLDEGINVFRVGSSNKRKTPFKKFGDEFLKRPESYKAKNISDISTGPDPSVIRQVSSIDDSSENPLTNNTREDGTQEELSRGQRFTRWGKDRGGKLARALFSGSPEDIKRLFGLIVKDVSQVAGGYIKNGSSKINSSFGNISGNIKHKLFGTEYSYQDGVDENGNPIIKNVSKNEPGGAFGYIKDNFNDMFKSAKDKSSKWFSTVASYFDFGDKDPEEKGVASKRKKLISASVGAFAGAGILGGPLGVIVGSLAGNALSNANISSKIKKLFFGHDKETGKPTGLISKAADAIISPIKFQIGKTVSFASNMVKKHIFGPLSDIGLAMKDRISNHVDSIFDKAKKQVWKVFGTLGGWITKGLAKVGIGASTFASGVATTMTGKLSRGALGTVGAAIGGAQTKIANTVAGRNSFHKLKRGEEFTVYTGQSYMDKDGKKRIATHDMSVVGGDTDIKVNTKSYLNQRRKNRNADINEDLENSGYYDSGTGVLGSIKGFFGGDYSKWHKEELLRRQQSREGLKSAMSEQVTTVTRDIADDTGSIEQSTASMANDIRLLTDEATTEGSLFTHDKGLHDRLDKIIEFLTGKKVDDLSPAKDLDLTTSKDKSSGDEEFVNSFVGATSTLMATGDNITNDEKRLGDAIVEEASKPDSNKTSILSKYKSLMEVQKEQSDDRNDKEDKKESIWNKIAGLLGGAGSILGSILGNIIPIGGAILAINALLGGDISNTFSNLSTSMERLVNWIKGDKEESNAALNVPLSLADARVDNSFDIINPLSTIKHVQTDAAGNDITNYSLTNARNQVYLENTRRGLFNNIFNEDISMMGDKSAEIMKEQRLVKQDKLMKKADKDVDKAIKAESKGRLDKKETLLDRGQKRINRANSLNEPTFLETHNRIRGAASVGSGIALGQGVGWITNIGTSAIARKMGLSDEAADMTGRATGAVVNVKVTKDALMGKGLAGKAKQKLLELVDFIFTSISKISKFKPILGQLDKLLSVIKDGIEGMSKTLVNRLCVLFGKETGKVSAEAATAGVGAAVLGVGGALQGGFTTDNLFQVPAGESDAGMKVIASTLGAIFTASPFIGLLEIVDIILQPITGKTLRQTLAQIMYTAFSPERSEKLSELQTELSNQTDAYNAKFGTSLNLSSYNDMVNRGMVSQIVNGGTVVGTDGTPVFDDAGSVVTTGGIKSAFISKQDYARDAEGNIIRDEHGNAVKAIDENGRKITAQKRDKNGQLMYDEYGNPIYEKLKLADHIGNIGSGIKNYFTGKTIYATDEGGNVIYDENGKPVVESKEDNLLTRTKNGLQEGWSSVSDTIKNRNKQIVDGSKKFFGKIASTSKKILGINDEKDNDLLATIKETGGLIGSFMISPALGISKGLSKLLKEKEEKDANGNPILDENGNAIKKGKLGEFAISSLGGFVGLAAKSVKELTSTISEWNNREYEVDENGKPIEIKDTKSSNSSRIKRGSLKDFMIGSLGSITSKIVNPIDEINKGAEEWERKNSPWKKDGKLSIKDWIGSKVGSFWDKITGNLSDNPVVNNTTKTVMTIAQKLGFGNIGGIGGASAEKESKLIEEANLGDVSPKDYKRDINSKGVGGGDSPLDFNVSGTVDEISSKINTGGNPLNKDFQVTSPYGYRGSPKTEFHRGVDLVPSDNSRQAEVGSRFNGTIKSVKSNVADTDHAVKVGNSYQYNGKNDTGNMVQILTDDGKLVTNMHLKAGSIPSSIRPGAKISAGDKIGEMGTTGWSTGPHLHYQIEDPSSSKKDPKGGNTIDPMTSIKSGSQVNSFNNSSGSTYSAASDSSISSESNGESGSSKTGIAGFLSAVSDLGTKFLNMITGGLFGDSSSSSEISSSSSNLSAEDIGQAALQLDPEVPIELLTNAQVNGISGIKAGEAEVLDLKSGISYKIYWGGPPGNRHTDYSTLTPDDTEKKIAAATSDGGTFPSWTPRPCILKIAGKQIAVGTHNFNHASIIGGNPGPKCPNKSDTRPPGGWEPGGHFCMYYKDSINTSGELSNNALEHQKAAAEAYELAVELMRKRKELESTSTISVKQGDQGIWDYLKKKGYNDYAIAGIMGNLHAESGLRSNNLQNEYEKKFGMNDEQYTMAVDNGSYKNFVNDSGGYGLAQWTYHSRKKRLLDYAKQKGTSIGDPGMQLDYLDKELNESYSGVVKTLKGAKSVKEASDVMLHDFERPKNHNTSSKINERLGYSQSFYNQFAGKSTNQLQSPSIPEYSDSMDTGGVGGADTDYQNDIYQNKYETKSNINTFKSLISNALNKVNNKSSKSNKVNPSMTDSSDTSELNYKLSVSDNEYTKTNVSHSNYDDNKFQENMMIVLYKILEQLQFINGNTNESSTLLDALNNKDFVDKGLRDSIDALGKVKSKKTTYPKSSNSTRMIEAMARP